MKKRVLIVEDDEALAMALHDNLVFDDFEVQCVSDGDAAVGAVRDFAPDLIVLDVNLPARDGFDLCRLWRQGRYTPIIMLTARNQKSDKLRGLQLGADDYITKPFDLDEFLARVHAVLRRARPQVDRLTLGNVTIDFNAWRAYAGSEPIQLSSRELELLHYLAERANTVVHRNELLRAVWGYPDLPFSRAVDQAVARLRKKIEPDAQNPKFIHTVHGDGYSLTPDAS